VFLFLAKTLPNLKAQREGSPLGSKRVSATPNAFARKHVTFW
jgi:hypothetical protein